MREVSEQELEVLASILGHDSDTSTSPKPSKPSSNPSGGSKISRPFYKKYSFYAFLSVLLGVVGFASVALTLYSVNKTLGDGVLEYFATTELTDDILQIASDNNVHGLSQAVYLYKNLGFVFTAIACVSLTLTLVFIFLEMRYREKENDTLRQEIAHKIEQEEALTDFELSIIEDSELE